MNLRNKEKYIFSSGWYASFIYEVTFYGQVCKDPNSIFTYFMEYLISFQLWIRGGFIRHIAMKRYDEVNFPSLFVTHEKYSMAVCFSKMHILQKTHSRKRERQKTIISLTLLVPAFVVYFIFYPKVELGFNCLDNI